MKTEVLSLMRVHGCFQGLEEEALAEIDEHLEVVWYKLNECVHLSNTPLMHIYFVVQGTLQVIHRDFQGIEKVLLVFSRNDQFDAIAGGVCSEQFLEGVFARTNCTLLKLEHEKALNLMSKHPKHRLNLLQAVARNLRQDFLEKESKPQYQYCAQDYQNLLQQFGMIAYMSRKGDCYANVPMKSFWELLKNGLVHYRKFTTRQHVIQQIAENIELFNIRLRKQKRLAHPSPALFTQRCYANLLSA